MLNCRLLVFVQFIYVSITFYFFTLRALCMVDGIAPKKYDFPHIYNLYCGLDRKEEDSYFSAYDSDAYTQYFFVPPSSASGMMEDKWYDTAETSDMNAGERQDDVPPQTTAKDHGGPTARGSSIRYKGELSKLFKRMSELLQMRDPKNDIAIIELQDKIDEVWRKYTDKHNEYISTFPAKSFEYDEINSGYKRQVRRKFDFDTNVERYLLGDIDQTIESKFDIKQEFNPTASSSFANNANKPHVNTFTAPEISNNELMQAMCSTMQQLSLNNDLPPPEIVKFSGKPSRFPTFKEDFTDMVLKTPLSESQKLKRLMQFLTGEALDAVQGYVNIGSGGLCKALNKLEERFGQKCLIVEDCVNTLLNMKFVNNGDRKALRKFSDDLSFITDTIISVDAVTHVSSANMVAIVQRLPFYIQTQWQKRAYDVRSARGSFPSITDLSDFVKQQADIANDPVYGVLGESKERRNRPYVISPHSTDLADETCAKCIGNHKLAQCTEFNDLSLDDKHKFVKVNFLCFKCLSHGHNADKCNVSRPCNVGNCFGRHHFLLHRPYVPPNDGETSVKQLYSISCSENEICKLIIPVHVYGKNGVVTETLAMLDTASNANLCERSLLDRLNVNYHSNPKTIKTNTVNGLDSRNAHYVDKLLISEPGMINNQMNIKIVWALPNLNISANKFQLNNLNHTNGKVELLIGASCPEIVLPIGYQKGAVGEPYVVETVLGKAYFGPSISVSNDSIDVNHVDLCADRLNVEIEKFWKFENVGLLTGEKAMSIEDKRALDTMSNSITRMANGHYSIALPWKHNPPNLPNNKPLALSRLNSLKRKFTSDQKFAERYSKVIGEYISKGFAEQIPNDIQLPLQYYLPHHAVFNVNKPNKLRVVFDAASQFKETSLNKQLLQGPDLNNNLVGVLLRFREEPVAVIADIESMFHQVGVEDEDCGALRFLWWKDGQFHNEPCEYRMKVHIFGATSSPSCATFALQTTAEDFKTQFDPIVYNAVMRNFYVDDLLKSVKDVDSAKLLINGLQELLGLGGFRITKWASNRADALVNVNENDLAKNNLNLDLELSGIHRTLGMLWDYKSDVFIFDVKDKSKPITKRGVMSTVFSIFDPLGILSPYVFKAKLILQNLWRDKVDWDAALTGKSLRDWNEWIDELALLNKLSISRCVKPIEMSNILEVQIHCFSDASELGYGAVCYLRVVGKQGNIHVNFLMGKSRLAPLKALTIPRLELQAAVLSTRVGTMVNRELDLDVDKIMYWTDSTIVLQFLNNESRRFKTYVANRISEIQDSSELCNWCYIGSEENPSDDVTRGLSSGCMISNCNWLNGPSFLRQSEKDWPVQPLIPGLIFHDELKSSGVISTCATVISGESFIERIAQRFSSYDRMKIAVAWLLKYVDYIRFIRANGFKNRASFQRNQLLNTNDIERSENKILLLTQLDHYKREMNALSLNDQLPTNSKIADLCPMLSNELLVVGGRLTNMKCTDRSKHPAIVPKGSSIAMLILKQIHEQNAHAGREFVLAALRRKFWIKNSRSLVRKLVNNCIKCRRLNTPMCNQKMSCLPPSRVCGFQAPFAYTGVDFFGPLYVKVLRSVIKQYGCIFTCFNSRAVHIELAGSLDTSSFINAFRRFTGRRGNPIELFSDRGTNFVSGHKELNNSIESLNQTLIHKQLLMRGISWKFNTPSASHMGGVWERMIRSVRRGLHMTLGQQITSHEVLSTLLIEIEFILNSRPLTYVSGDVGDMNPISPNDILLQKPHSGLPPGVFTNADMYSRKRWRHVQFLANQFWKRWRSEYISTFQSRQIWSGAKRNLKVGDVVTIAEENSSRGLWPMARVIAVYEGKDGLVRNVKLKTKDTELMRPISKLCLLMKTDEQQTI